MNPAKTLDDMLDASRAVLIRQGKHKVYALGNGGRFVMASTPSDWRATLNNISDLRRKAGLARAPKPVTLKPPPPPVVAPPPPEPQPEKRAGYEDIVEYPTLPSDPSTPLAQNLDQLIADGEELITELTDQAATVERQVAFLKTIRAHANDPMTEPLLALLVPQQQQPAPPPPPPVIVRPPATPPPPKLEITRATLRAVIPQLTKDPFTLDDIYEFLTHNRILSSYESKPIKKIISETLCRIAQLDNIIGRVRAGTRGSPTVWTRDVKPAGTRVELSSHSEPEPETPQETT